MLNVINHLSLTIFEVLGGALLANYSKQDLATILTKVLIKAYQAGPG